MLPTPTNVTPHGAHGLDNVEATRGQRGWQGGRCMGKCNMRPAGNKNRRTEEEKGDGYTRRGRKGVI